MFESLGMSILVAAGGLITTIFKTIKFVQEGELGIRLRFGRATRNSDGTPKIITPGFVLLIPFLETLKRHHVRQQTLKLDDQKIMIKRGLIFNVGAIVIWRVKDIYRALFEIHELDESIADLSMGILRDILAHKEYTDLSDMETISEQLLHKLQEKADEWGVTFIQFKLTNCAPTVETAPLVNAEAGVRLKLEAIQLAAKDMKIDLSAFPANLAAALIGIPLVTSVTSEVHLRHHTKTNSLINFGASAFQHEGDSEE